MAAVIHSLQLNLECTTDVSSTSTASLKKLSWHNQVDWKPKQERYLMRWTCLRHYMYGKMHRYGYNMTERHAWHDATL